MGVVPIANKMCKAQLWWFGVAMNKTALQFNPGGHQPHGRPIKHWMVQAVNVAPDDALDQ